MSKQSEIIKAINTTLDADADVSGVVSNRVYFVDPPQDATAPYIVLHLDEDSPIDTFDDSDERRMTLRIEAHTERAALGSLGIADLLDDTRDALANQVLSPTGWTDAELWYESRSPVVVDEEILTGEITFRIIARP